MTLHRMLQSTVVGLAVTGFSLAGPAAPVALAPAVASAQSGTPGPTGIYVYSEHLAQDAQPLSQALTLPGVDGLTLLQGWASLEPDRGTFDWSELDQWMNAAVAANKQVALAIRAGQDTPCWLFQPGACGRGGNHSYAGATPLTFEVSPREGVGQAQCNQVTVAAPWDSAFQGEWDALLQAVAGHLNDAGTYGALSSVRLTGIDRTTSELRLPAEILTKPCVANSVQTWRTANPPYNPSLLLGAWDKVTDSFLNAFPDKYFGVELIPTGSGDQNLEYPFPAIDDNGCAYAPPWPTDPRNPNAVPGVCLNTSPVPDQNAPLLALANQKLAGRLSISYQNLDIRQPASPYVVQTAQALGTTIGFQTNDYDHLQRAACSGGSANPGACNTDSYLRLLEVGTYPLGKTNSLRASYVEVLPPDANAFPTAIQQAHAELTGGR